MRIFRSIKLYDGFSTCFRQWKAEGTHCSFLHGYAISFLITFEGELDERNWIYDFGGFKRAKKTIDGRMPNDWMNYMFDHTTIISIDDPELEWFKEANKKNVLQLRILSSVGAERFAEFVFQNINYFINKETNGRVRVVSVECKENNKNSAFYSE